MRTVLCAVVVVVATGCASAPTDRKSTSRPDREAEAVAIAEEEDRVSECSFLAEVQVDSPYAMLSKAYPEVNFATRYEMRIQLRRETRQAGGNTVLPTELEGGQLHGKAYDCPEQAETAEKRTG